ncbi:MAG: hypothetical protein NZ480_03850 [Bdellovibrionaceae bacterium]|nr:hypothetical protein [Pseudobdellovibrionaceae bacterium]
MNFCRIPTKLLLWCLAPWCFQQCALPEPSNELPNNHAGQGNFFVADASGAVIATTSLNKIDLPKSRTVSFRVCLQDRRARTPIMNQTFELFDEDKKPITSSMTDHTGCLNWSEELNFPFLKQNHNILLVREIRNYGRWNGQTWIRFVLNPWTNLVMSEIEKDFKSQTLQPISWQELYQKPDTAVVRVNPSRALYTIQRISGSEALFKFNFMGELFIESRDYLNTVTQIRINRARFRSRMTLINLRKNGTYHMVYRSPWSDLQDLKESLLIVESEFNGNTGTCPNGRILVGLEIDISNAEFSLKPFEMLYQGPNCQATGLVLMVADPQFVEAINHGRFNSLNDFIKNVGLETGQYPSTASQAPTEGGVGYLNQLQFYGATLQSLDNNTFSATRNVKIHTCFQSVMDYEQLRREQLEITTIGKQTLTVVTDDLGCFSWQEVFVFNQFEPQCWRIGTVTIRSLNTKIQFRIPIAYSHVGKEDAYYDLRYFKVPKNQLCSEIIRPRKPKGSKNNKFISQLGSTLIKWIAMIPQAWANDNPEQPSDSHLSEIHFTTFNIQTSNAYYKVDHALNLIFVRKVIFNITPTLYRRSIIDQTGLFAEMLPRGPYRLTFAIISSPGNTHLSEKIEGEWINTFQTLDFFLSSPTYHSNEIEIEFFEHKNIGNINKLCAKIEPLNMESKRYLKTVIFCGNFFPYESSQSVTLQPINPQKGDILEKMRQAYISYQNKKLRNSLLISNKLNYSHHMKFKLVNVTYAQETQELLEKINNPLWFQEVRKKLSSSSQEIGLLPKPHPDLFLVNPIRSEWLSSSTKITPAILKQWIEYPNKIEEYREQLCYLWFADLTYRPLPGKQYSVFTRSIPALINERIDLCRSKVRTKGLSSMFKVQTVNFVKNPRIGTTNSGVQKFRGQYRELSLGQNFSKNRTISETYSETITLNPLRFDLWSMPLMSGQIPTKLAVIGISPGVNFSISRVISDTEGDNMYESVFSNISLVSEIIDIFLESDQSERCISIQLNPKIFSPSLSYFNGKRPSLWMRSFHHRLSQKERADFATGGILLCEGIKRPLCFKEHYGIFNQKAPSSPTIMNPYQTENRPFFMSVRGLNDYLKVVSFMTHSLKIPRGFEGDFEKAGFREDDLKDLFFTGLPAYPGVTYAPPQPCY